MNRGLGVPLQLRHRMAERAQRGDGAQLTRLEIEPGTGQHFAEGEVDRKSDKVWGNIGRGKNRRRGVGASKPLERVEAGRVAIRVHGFKGFKGFRGFRGFRGFKGSRGSRVRTFRTRTL